MGELHDYARLVGALSPTELPGENIDSPAELLADAFAAEGITLALASRILEWTEARADQDSVNYRAGLVVRALLDRICTSPNPATTAESLRIGFGFRRDNNDGVRTAARKLGCTPAAVSKLSLRFRRMLGLSVNSFSKPETAVATYRATNGRKTHRNAPGDAAQSGTAVSSSSGFGSPSEG